MTFSAEIKANRLDSLPMLISSLLGSPKPQFNTWLVLRSILSTFFQMFLNSSAPGQQHYFSSLAAAGLDTFCVHVLFFVSVLSFPGCTEQSLPLPGHQQWPPGSQTLGQRTVCLSSWTWASMSQPFLSTRYLSISYFAWIRSLNTVISSPC